MSEASTGTGTLFMNGKFPQNCGNYLGMIKGFTDEQFF